ncbi:MAG: carboxypeptidase regulatory-like domain-containing protein [Nitrospirae bacterium]|nr:carboxypeptidase regulatory-like domain-containing protein [Nitrospirota bacterium]MBF0534637.1 carboxypeptidase regulatory-like domain-containing protein [Nitrospirota bacterium]MBF0616319.1 carboxypeptidase regulatory-like domain-containing protein [Nitrospirota bacterium]
MKKLVALMCMVMFLCVSAVAFAADKYEVVDVKDGGSIKGIVKTSGAPADPVLDINKDTEYCGKSHPAGMYVVGAGGGVKNVIVAVEDITKGKAAPKTDTVIDNHKCAFEPLVSIAYMGQKYIMKNSDPIFHNTSIGLILAPGKKRTVYNLALPNKDQTIEKPVKVAGLESVSCDAHSWMRAFVYATPNPYAAITDDKGSFEIKDIPAGKYKVKFWHEGFGEAVVDVEVKAGATATLDHTFAKK